MTVTSMSAATTACDLRGWRLSNLELQKVLYIGHMIHLGRTGQPLVDEEFEAWDYGPVLPSVYREAAIFGRDPVRDVFGEPPVAAGTREFQTMKEVDTFLAPFSAGRLVAMTHWDHGAWAAFYKRGARHIRIPNEAVANEFRERQRRQPPAE